MSIDAEPHPSTSDARGKYGPYDWDTARKAFSKSIMIETPLQSLAQNLDMPEWPIRAEGEAPSKYVYLKYSELTAMPGFAGHPELVDQLITILKETMAFDEPFGDMVPKHSLSVEKDNPILKNLIKLGIPEDYPMGLVALTAETREFCTLESLGTIKEFAMFAQNLAQAVIVGGDFRALLNALSHIDENTLALYLPFRPGSKGVHLLEGLALTVRAYPAETRAALARECGARLGAEDLARASAASRADTSAAATTLAGHTASYAEYFKGDLAVLQQQVNEGLPLGRLANVINDPLVESIVTNLLKPYLTFPDAKKPHRATTPPMEEEAPRRSFFAGLRRMFKI